MPETSCAEKNLFSSRVSDYSLIRHRRPASLGEPWLDIEFTTSSRGMPEIQHITILHCFLLPPFPESKMSSIYLQILRKLLSFGQILNLEKPEEL